MTDFHNGLTPAEEEMLTLMIEECSEVIKACTKIKRYGKEATRMEDLTEETADVIACIGVLAHNGFLDPESVNEMARLKLLRIKDPYTRRVHFITPEMIP